MYAFPPGVAPLCSEDDLPVPANGNKSCKIIMSHDLKCELTCSANHHFGTSLDISPQYCRNGEWDFQRDGQSVPDCVGEVNIVHARYIQAYLSSNQLRCEVALVCELSFSFSVTTSLLLILIFSEFPSHSMSAVEAHCNQESHSPYFYFSHCSCTKTQADTASDYGYTPELHCISAISSQWGSRHSSGH